MNQNDWEILQTRKAQRRKQGEVHTGLSQWHQGIGGHGYVKLGVSQGVHFNLFAALRHLNDSIANPHPPKVVKAKPLAPVRVGIGGTLAHERRDASGILLPTAYQRRYTPIAHTAITNQYGLKPLNVGFDKQRMD